MEKRKGRAELRVRVQGDEAGAGEGKCGTEVARAGRRRRDGGPGGEGGRIIKRKYRTTNPPTPRETNYIAAAVSIPSPRSHLLPCEGRLPAAIGGGDEEGGGGGTGEEDGVTPEDGELTEVP